MKMPSFIIVVMIFLFSTQIFSDTGFRKYAGVFMEIDVSARAQALGGAFSAMANDVYAPFYNPAGLAQIKDTQFGFTHTQQFISSVNYDYMGFVKQFSQNKTFGISFVRLGVDDIQNSQNAQILNSVNEWNLDYSKITKFNTADYVFFFSLGQEFRSKLAIGFNAKLIHRSFSDNNANGLGFDAGLLYKLKPGWNLSAMFRNITSTLIAWNTGEKELVHPSFRFGSSYTVRVPGINSTFTPNVDLVYHTQSLPTISDNGFNSSSFSGIFGGELVFNNRLFLRTGYDDLQRNNFGVGIRIPHIQVDYSYTNYEQELGIAHRIGLVVNFKK